MALDICMQCTMRVCAFSKRVYTYIHLQYFVDSKLGNFLMAVISYRTFNEAISVEMKLRESAA